PARRRGTGPSGWTFRAPAAPTGRPRAPPAAGRTDRPAVPCDAGRSPAAPGPRPPEPATDRASAARRPDVSHKQRVCVIPSFSALTAPAAAEKRLLRGCEGPHTAAQAG